MAEVQIKCEKCRRLSPSVWFSVVAFMKLGSAMFGRDSTFPIICDECFHRITKRIQKGGELK